MTFRFGSSLEKYILDIIIMFNILHVYFIFLTNDLFFTYFRSFKQIVILGIIGLIFLFVIVPSIFRWSTLVQRQMVFLPWGEHKTIIFFFNYKYLPELFITDGTKNQDLKSFLHARLIYSLISLILKI